MTRDEKIKAFTMKVDGYSYEQISEELHYARTSIYSELLRECSGKPNVRYPVLFRRIKSDYGSIKAFCEQHPIDSVSMSTLFSEKRKIAPKAIGIVCSAYPNIPYNELFM